MLQIRIFIFNVSALGHHPLGIKTVYLPPTMISLAHASNGPFHPRSILINILTNSSYFKKDILSLRIILGDRRNFIAC